MRWHKLAGTPPAYVLERISDLLRAAEISKTSPSNAKSLVQSVITQLDKHLDKEYIGDLKAADMAMLDNPSKASVLIGVAISRMRSDKDKYDNEKEQPWLTWLR